MSPTSYQAAPPSTTTIAEQSNSVKFVANRLPFLVLSFPKFPSPARVRSPVHRGPFTARMHVVNPRAGLVRAQYRIPHMRHPIFLMAHRIVRDLAQVVSLHQIVKRLWSLLLIQRVIVDRLAHRLHALLQHSLPLALDP